MAFPRVRAAPREHQLKKAEALNGICRNTAQLHTIRLLSQACF